MEAGRALDRWRGRIMATWPAAGGKLYLLGGLGALNGETFAYDPGSDRLQLVGRTVAVKAGGAAWPLVYVSPGQVNLFLPPELGTGVESAALPVKRVASSPGIFALGQEGQGQGAILIAGTAQLAGEGRPARRGEAVEI